MASLLSACGGGGGDGDGAEFVVEPERLTCSSSGSAPVVLVWTAAVSANGYRVYYRSAPGSYLQNIGAGLDAGNVTTYSVAGLVGGTAYAFAVTAYGLDGESDFSNEVCQTIQ